MISKRSRRFLIVVGIVLGLIVAYWVLDRARWTVTGQVVDTETGLPIQGAAVAIEWWEPAFGTPGLSGSRDLDIGETVSDAQGYFSVPAYSTFGLAKQFNMVVYKKGYVCWSSKKIFPSYEKRQGFSPKNGMKIRLQPFNELYSKEEHAVFVGHMQPMIGAPLFHEAIKSENDLAGEIIRREWGK